MVLLPNERGWPASLSAPDTNQSIGRQQSRSPSRPLKSARIFKAFWLSLKAPLQKIKLVFSGIFQDKPSITPACVRPNITTDALLAATAFVKSLAEFACEARCGDVLNPELLLPQRG